MHLWVSFQPGHVCQAWGTARQGGTQGCKHGYIPPPPWGRPSPIMGRSWQKPRGDLGRVGDKKGDDLMLQPSTDLSKWKLLAIIITMEAGHKPGMCHPHTPKPTLIHSPFCALP